MVRIRIIIAGRSKSGRRGLVSIFSSSDSFQVIGEASYDELLSISTLNQPDVILCDQPGINHDLKFIREIKSSCPCTRIITLTGTMTMENKALLLLETDGFVPKNTMPQLLLKIVELSCRAGICCLPSSLRDYIAALADNYSGEPRNEEFAGSPLTKRELEILKLMSKNYSNKSIARELFISEPTVKTHVSSILRKLGQPNRTQAIVHCYRNGILGSAAD